MDILKTLAQEFGIKEEQVKNTVALIFCCEGDFLFNIFTITIVVARIITT